MQVPQTQSDAVKQVLRKYTPEVREAFLQAIYTARAQVDMTALVAALDRKDIDAAVQLLELKPETFWSMTEALRGAFMTSASYAVATMPKWVSANFSFNGNHPEALEIVRRQGANLVQGIEAEEIQAIRLYLQDALVDNPRGVKAIALDITGKLNKVTGRREGGIIGLTSQQTDWVIRARQELQQLDGRYLRRRLRDKRLDAMVKQALSTGKPLSNASVDKIVNRYKDKLLAYRGQMIAENETFTAQSMGRHQSMSQILEQGLAEKVTKKWIHGFSKQPRADHRRLDGMVKDFQEDFTMGDGTLMAMPHDPRGGAKHSAKCKCTMFYRAIPPKE